MKINDGTEASINRPVVENLFENDIVLTVPQAKAILKEVKNGKNKTSHLYIPPLAPPPKKHRARAEPKKRKPRQAQPTPNSFWKNLTISYKFQLEECIVDFFVPNHF